MEQLPKTPKVLPDLVIGHSHPGVVVDEQDMTIWKEDEAAFFRDDPKVKLKRTAKMPVKKRQLDVAWGMNIKLAVGCEWAGMQGPQALLPLTALLESLLPSTTLVKDFNHAGGLWARHGQPSHTWPIMHPHPRSTCSAGRLRLP